MSEIKWNIEVAKKWMFDTGVEHIETGSFLNEGADLIYAAKHGDVCDSMEEFKTFISDVLWWDTDTIEEAIGEIMGTEQPKSEKNGLTVKDIVHQLIESNSAQWLALPKEVRDMMLSNPERFEFRYNKDNSIPMIAYNGVVLRCHYWATTLNTGHYSWALETIDQVEK